MKTIQLFTSTTCMPCVKAKTICKSFIDSGTIQILDVKNNQTLVSEHDIRSVPTFLLFENEKEIDRMTGINNEVMTKIINFLK